MEKYSRITAIEKNINFLEGICPAKIILTRKNSI
jgi:hypothetical protein